MTGRETAWRVLALEFQSSLYEEKGVGERAASHLLSPLGARMNRVLMYGTLGPGEAVGGDESRPFLRSRLTDPTGAVTVTAGSYQPRALAALKAISAAGPFLVVGKAHLYRGRNDVVYGSVRTEALRPATPEELRAGLAEAAEQTLDRIELSERLRAGRSAPEDGLTASRVEAARAAIGRYPSTDPGTFRDSVGTVVRFLETSADSPSPGPPAAAATPRVRVTRTPLVAPSEPVVSAAGRAQESAFLDLIDDLSDRSADGYADLREALGLASQRGMSPEEAERLLNRLEEEGVLEEPIVGKVRRA